MTIQPSSPPRATAGGDSFTYDANGNMTGGGGKTFAWDAYNRLSSMTVPVGGEDKTVTFLYDADGRRIQRSLPSSSLPNKYFGKMVYTYGAWMHKYVYAGNILVAKTQSRWNGDYIAPTRLWYHADHLGSTRIMTRSTGARTNSYDYEAYGASALLGGSASNDRTFTGHIEDPDLGLVYMVARYYDANLGRFISPDSLVPDVNNPQAFNRYSYVANNPISNVDPTGHFFGLYFETPVDVLSTGIGIVNLEDDLRNHNWGWAAISGMGLAWDAFSITGPWMGGASPVIRGMRAEGAASFFRNVAIDSVELVLKNKKTKFLVKESEDVSEEILKNFGSGKYGSLARNENVVYRGLAEGEEISAGISARVIDAGNTPKSHVRGMRESQWISTTKDETIAIEKYGQHGVVKIDLSKVTNEVVDVSGGFPGKDIRAHNYAVKDAEVLIKNFIPSQAITRIK